MNNQELIEYCESLKGSSNKFINGIDVNKIIAKIEQLDEPKEKVTLPRPVANWISCVRGRNKTLLFALENAPIEVNLWFCEDEKNRQNIFADAWVNGYHIEKEKRYIVTVKNIGNDCKYLKWNSVQRYWYFGNGKNIDDIRLYHTLENLQKGGFGNVFVNPLFVIEEVE
jgi:hypothetical protein